MNILRALEMYCIQYKHSEISRKHVAYDKIHFFQASNIRELRLQLQNTIITFINLNLRDKQEIA